MTVTVLPTQRPLDPPLRAEREEVLADYVPVQVAAIPLWRRALDSSAWRQAALLALLATVWEIAARAADNDLLFPSFVSAARALWEGLYGGELLVRAGISLKLLLQGYALGVLLALGLTALATSSRWGRDLLSSLTAMFNPLPAIALLPLALLWFGLGSGSLIFVLVHAVLWPLALAASAGFSSFRPRISNVRVRKCCISNSKLAFETSAETIGSRNFPFRNVTMLNKPEMVLAVFRSSARLW